MKAHYFSYRYAREILEHESYRVAWNEVCSFVRDAPVFVYPGKSSKNRNLDVVQQVQNTYFDRRFVVDSNWQYHPLATGIAASNLKADYRKSFSGLTIQAEVQFGNMSRWYSDIFKFQTAYSQNLIQLGLSIVPMSSLARRIDSNIVNYERATRELPSAVLSITLPILLIGVEPDDSTQIVDISTCGFNNVRDITGKGNELNRWRIVNGFLNGSLMSAIGPGSGIGPVINSQQLAEESEDEE
jgi:hypothetical protein